VACVPAEGRRRAERAYADRAGPAVAREKGGEVAPAPRAPDAGRADAGCTGVQNPVTDADAAIRLSHPATRRRHA
jgi:hypothetical protein